jgi:hypothetical protein
MTDLEFEKAKLKITLAVTERYDNMLNAMFSGLKWGIVLILVFVVIAIV